MSEGAVLLVGAGGHAKAIVEALGSDRIAAYVASADALWLSAEWINSDELALQSQEPEKFVMGLGGASKDELRHRYSLFERYLNSGREAPAVRHPTAHISPSAQIEAGAIILAGAIVQPDAVVGRAAIVNSGAILEHDSNLGAGSHLAPRAILLGGVTVGRCAMIGAGAVILPDREVGDEILVPANSLYPPKSARQ